MRCAMFVFGKNPPAAPLPPPAGGLALSTDLLRMLVPLVIFSGTLFFVLVLWVRMKWDKWLDAATRRAFARIDGDKSGSINKNELYVGVLELYLQLHGYGIRAKAPPKARVMRIMEECDVDNSGTLDYTEFKMILTVLTQLVFSRALTQIGLTILCPVVAPYVCAAFKACLFRAMGSVYLSVPVALSRMASRLPSTLDETIMSSVLMLSMIPALNRIDSRAEARAAARAAQEDEAGASSTAVISDSRMAAAPPEKSKVQ